MMSVSEEVEVLELDGGEVLVEESMIIDGLLNKTDSLTKSAGLSTI